MTALPMLELNDLPETTAGIVRQNARWYKGVLDDVLFLVADVACEADRVQPRAAMRATTRSPCRRPRTSMRR